MKNKNLILGLCVFSLIAGASEVRAEGQYAGKERSTVAKAHISRARTLLVEALEEFEESRKYARPDLLLDSEDWRLRVISLTEQLNRVIDPKARVTREGAVFRVPPRLVKREKDNLPIVPDGAKSRSDFGEKDRMESKQNTRARLFSNKGGNKEPLRVGKNEANKGQLPPDLAVPEEPKIAIDPNNDPLKKRNTLDEKALFTEELLPQIKANKEEAKKQALDETTKAEGEDPSQNTTPEKQDSDIEIIDEETVPAKNIGGDTNPPANPQELGKEEDELYNKLPSENLGSKYDAEAAKPNGLLQEPKNDIKSQIDEELNKEEGLSAEEARKQLSEDEELAKRLDDTVYDRNNSGN